MATTGNEAGKENPRGIAEAKLESWKEIATYVKRGVRTVQRWQEKGLPVHRQEATGTVYAYPSEIDAWLASPKHEGMDAVEPEAAVGVTATLPVQAPSRKSHYYWILAACGGALVIAVTAFLFARWPTRQNRAAGRSFAVFEFRNLSEKAESNWLSTALAELFRSELELGGRLGGVPGEEVARMKRELALPSSDTYSKATLRRISANVPADWVVLGSYLATGKEDNEPLRIQVKVQDTRTGETVATDVETGTEATLLDVVDRAGRSLRAKLGAAEPSAGEILIAKRALPRNLEAQRLYAEGLSKLRLLDTKNAAEVLTLAIQIEPTYAQAHAALAEAWKALGYEAKAKDEAMLAYDSSAALAPQDALLIEAQYRELTKDWVRAVAIYKKLSEFGPDNIEYPLKLAHVQILSGQADAASTTLSRLRKEITQSAGDPEIDLMEALAAESTGDFKHELAVAGRAEADARRKETKSILAQALLRECWAAYKLGQSKRAIAKAQEAREIFAAMSDRAGEAQALKNVADVVDDQGDHAQGKKLYEAALTIFREIGYQAGTAVTLNNLAYAIKDLGDLAGARKTFEESLVISREIADQGREALALNGLGIVLWRQGDLPRAQQMFEDASAIHQKRGDKSRTAILVNNVALVLEDQGRLEEAKTRFEESLQILRKIDNKDGVARDLGNLGDLLVKQGKLEEARSRFDEQVRLGKAIPEPKQVAYGLNGLGNVLLTEGDLKGARAQHEEALAMRRKMGEKGLAAESQLALAAVAREEAKFSEAHENARQAANEFQAENEKDLAAQANNEMVLVLVAEGNLPQAQQAFAKARQLSANTTDYAIKLDLMLTYGRLAAAMSNVTEAMKDFEFVRRDAARHGYIGYEFEARIALAEMALRTGKPQARAIVQVIEKEAQSKHLGLIARRAALLLQRK